MNSSDKLVIYTSKGCPSCKRVKAILDKEGITYITKELDEEDTFIEALTFQIATVPTIRKGNKTLFAKKSTTGEILEFLKS